MSEQKELLEKLNQLKQILQPAKPELHDAEHVKAHVRVAFENLYSAFFDMNQLLQYTMRPKEEQNATDEELEKMKKSAQRGIDVFAELMDEEQLDPWEKLVSKEHMESFQNGLEEIHTGDCTGYSCSCMRCVSEIYYKLPSSVSWKNKSEGSGLLAQYNALNSQREVLERAVSLDEQVIDKSNSIYKKSKI